MANFFDKQMSKNMIYSICCVGQKLFFQIFFKPQPRLAHRKLTMTVLLNFVDKLRTLMQSNRNESKYDFSFFVNFYIFIDHLILGLWLTQVKEARPFSDMFQILGLLKSAHNAKIQNYHDYLKNRFISNQTIHSPLLLHYEKRLTK